MTDLVVESLPERFKKRLRILDFLQDIAAGKAVPGPDEPPEFAMWIAALRDPRIPDIEREDIMSAIYDLFDPDRG